LIFGSVNNIKVYSKNYFLRERRVTTVVDNCREHPKTQKNSQGKKSLEKETGGQEANLACCEYRR
jgi:hypothetical protein